MRCPGTDCLSRSVCQRARIAGKILRNSSGLDLGDPRSLAALSRALRAPRVTATRPAPTPTRQRNAYEDGTRRAVASRRHRGKIGARFLTHQDGPAMSTRDTGPRSQVHRTRVSVLYSGLILAGDADGLSHGGLLRSSLAPHSVAPD